MPKIESNNKPERRRRIPKFITAIITAAMLGTSSFHSEVKPAKAQHEVEVVGGRPATFEESKTIGKLRNSESTSCTFTVLGKNTLLTALHCVPDTLDGMLNPNIRATIFNDTNSEQRTVARIIQPEGVPLANEDAVVLVLSKEIPLGNGVEPIVLDGGPLPEGVELQIEGFGRRENGHGSTIPIIASTEILAPEQNWCAYGRERLATRNFFSYADHGDSGGPLGYFVGSPDGSLTFHQIGIVATVCNDINMYETVNEGPLHDGIKAAVQQAETRTSYEPVPLTSTRVTIDGESAVRTSSTFKEVYQDQSTVQLITLEHYQDPTLQTEVVVTGINTTIDSPTSCLSVNFDQSFFPFVLRNGLNHLPQIKFTSTCTTNPFGRIAAGTVHQEILIEKEVPDGTLPAKIRRITEVYQLSPLQIDPATITANPVLYDDENGTLITGKLLEGSIKLDITTPLRPSTLNYVFTNVPQAQSENSIQGADVFWSTEELKTPGTLTRSITIPIPATPEEPVVPEEPIDPEPQETFLPSVRT